MVSLLGVGHVERHHIGLAQQLFQGEQLHLQLGGAFARQVRVVRDHLHAERAGDLRDVPADPAQPDDADRLAAELRPLEPLAVPLAAPHRLGRPGDVAHQREQQPHRMLGRAHRVRTRRVHHRDAAPGGGVDVDRVHPGPRARDHLEARRAGQQIRGHVGLAPHDERMRPSQRPLELVARLARQAHDLDLRRLGEQPHPRLGHAIGQHDAVRHDSKPPSKASSSSRAPSV